MEAKLSVILFPRHPLLPNFSQALNSGIQPKNREHRYLREDEEKDPSVSVVSEKSLAKSDGDQLQAKEVMAANTNLHFPN
jgi:hypothetical protein